MTKGQMEDKEFNKFLIISKDKPEDVVGFIQLKKGMDLHSTDSLMPVIIKEKIEHFLLVKNIVEQFNATPLPSPSAFDTPPFERKELGYFAKVKQLFSRKKIDKPETV